MYSTSSRVKKHSSLLYGRRFESDQAFYDTLEESTSFQVRNSAIAQA